MRTGRHPIAPGVRLMTMVAGRGGHATALAARRLEERVDAEPRRSDDGTAMTRLALVSALVLSVLAACSGDGVGPVIEAARQASQRSEGSSMRLTSSAFEPGADIPRRFTCDGQDVSPPLALHDIPVGRPSLVLVMDDPDAPGGTWDHWVAYDIPVRPTSSRRASGSWASLAATHGDARATAAPARRAGRIATSSRSTPWTRPWACRQEPRSPSVLEAIEGHVLAEARLMGRYARSADESPPQSPPGVRRCCLRRLTGRVLPSAGRPACRAGGARRRGSLTPAGSHGHEDAIGEQEEHDGQWRRT